MLLYKVFCCNAIKLFREFKGCIESLNHLKLHDRIIAIPFLISYTD